MLGVLPLLKLESDTHSKAVGSRYQVVRSYGWCSASYYVMDTISSVVATTIIEFKLLTDVVTCDQAKAWPA